MIEPIPINQNFQTFERAIKFHYQLDANDCCCFVLLFDSKTLLLGQACLLMTVVSLKSLRLAYQAGANNRVKRLLSTRLEPEHFIKVS